MANLSDKISASFTITGDQFKPKALLETTATFTGTTPSLDLEHYITSYGNLTYRYLLDKMDLKRILEMGREAGKLESPNSDPVYCIYKAVLGREPDQGGYDFWNGHYKAGNLTLGEIITEIENSSEAQGK